MDFFFCIGKHYILILSKDFVQYVNYSDYQQDLLVPTGLQSKLNHDCHVTHGFLQWQYTIETRAHTHTPTHKYIFKLDLVKFERNKFRKKTGENFKSDLIIKMCDISNLEKLQKIGIASNISKQFLSYCV